MQPRSVTVDKMAGILTKQNVQPYSWTIFGGSQVDISCTQMYYICFIRVIAEGCWVIVHCFAIMGQKRSKNTDITVQFVTCTQFQ